MPRKDRPNVLLLAGEVDLHVSPIVRTSLNGMIAKKPKQLVVDLSGVPYIDKRGTGGTYFCVRAASRRGIILAYRRNGSNRIRVKIRRTDKSVGAVAELCLNARTLCRKLLSARSKALQFPTVLNH
jgi:hypothetical protein